jgi:hypothetical protein
LNFANDKTISDLNDYLFNKPFLMLINNNVGTESFDNLFDLKQSFETTNAYFYNIPFKINASSKINFDDIESVYLMPLSTQQFFNKTGSNYYSIDLVGNKMLQATDNQIIQKRFNPAYDEFNLSTSFLDTKNYSYILVDQIIGKINDITDSNPDYKKIIDSIDQTNNTFISSIISILNYSSSLLYGRTTKFILSNLININKISDVFSNKMINYDLLTYLNLDYLKYSHYALELQKTDEKDNSNIKLNPNVNSNLFKVISPVYQMYDSSKKIGRAHV